MLSKAVNLPSGEEFSPDPRPSSSSSGKIKIFGVSIAPFNNKEEDDSLNEGNLEISEKGCAETSHKRKTIEFRDFLSSMNSKECSPVEESNSHDVEQVQVVQHENPIIIEDAVEAEDEDEDEAEDPPNHWTIKKVLKKSDVNGSSRLLMGRKEVLSHIAPFFTHNNNPSEFCQNNEEIHVFVYDVDTSTEHALRLAKWKTGSFVLKNNWMQQFVKRRTLMENDEVGLRWDAHGERLEFSLLKRHVAE